MREIALDLAEGADIVMVKPALPYLDLIYRASMNSASRWRLTTFRASTRCSGGGPQRVARRDRAVMEVLTSIQAAGADMILTYSPPR